MWWRIRHFWDNLKRASSCFLLGWRTPDWDYCYLLKMIVWKLKRMDKAMLNGYATYPKKTRRKLLTVIHLIERVIAGKPEHKYLFELIKEKWEGHKWMETEGNPEVSQLKFAPHPPSLDRRIKTEMGLEQQAKQREWELLMKLLNKQLRKWWD